MRGHAYDALVGFAGCDKTLPGIMMAMVRLNAPSVFVYGGAMLPGRWRGRDVDRAHRLRGRRRGAGRHHDRGGACGAGAGVRADRRLVPRPVHGQHHGDGVGGAGPGAAGIGDAARRLFRAPGAWRGARAGASPRSWRAAARCRATSSPASRWRMRPPWWRQPAARPTPACICPPSPTRPGIRFTLDDVAEVFARTPLIADLQPGGRYLAVDVFRAGGTDAVLKALLDGGYLHGDALTLSGQTLAEHLAGHGGPDGEVVRPASQPLSPTGGLVVLRGNLAPDGALIKVAGLKTLAVRGPSPRVRRRGGVLRGGAGAPIPRGRCADHPQRGPQGRAGHARDAGRHGADLRPGHGREGGARHRRPLLRRHAGHDGRLRGPGGGCRGADRAGARWRSRAHRLRRAHHRPHDLRRRSWPPAARPTCRARRSASPACSRSTPSWSARPAKAR